MKLFQLKDLNAAKMIIISVGRQYTPGVMTWRTAQRQLTALARQRQDCIYLYPYYLLAFLAPTGAQGVTYFVCLSVRVSVWHKFV